METIHVVLCGREGDTLRVRGALHGSATMPHAAWSRKYVFACSAVTRMRDVDATLRDVCHVIVLCSRSSSDTSSPHDDSNTSSGYSSSSDHDDNDEDVTCYGNRPVLALDTAASSTRVAQLRDEECFYGICTLAEMRARVLRVALAPSHLVYDALLRCLTPCGRRAYHRAFWLLDTDDDGVLTRDDVRAWRQATSASSSATTTTRCTDADVTALLRCAAAAAAASGDDDMKASDDHEGNDDDDDDSGSRSRDDRAATATADEDATASHARGMGERAFVALHTRWLARGDVLQAWATLQLAGTQPTHGGAPYTWHDLHAVRVDAATNTYLSPHAVQFFRNVYKRRYVRDVARTWSVTPGCPWHDGCYDVDVDSDGDGDDGTSTHAARHDRDRDSDRHRRRSTTTPLSLDAFIEQWKYLALERRDVVVQYARYWAYKGSSSSLFVRRRCRAARDVDETPPDTIQVLVVGAAHAGKRTLIDMLTANDDDDRVAMRTTTRHAQRRRRHDTTQQHRHTVDDSDDDNDVVSDGVSKLSSSAAAAATTTTSDAHNDSGSGSKSSAPRPRRPRSAHASRRDVDGVVGGGRRHDNNNSRSSNTTHTRRTGTTSSSPAATAAPRLYVRTTTRLVQRRGGGEAASSSTAFAAASEAPQTIIYTTLVSSSSSRHGTRRHASTSAADDDDDDSDDAAHDADAATVVLCNASLNKTFDAVLLCCDASALPRSTRYIAALYTRAAQSRNCARMPFVVVLTKSDALAPQLPSSSLSSSHTRASAPRGRTAATTMRGSSSVATMLLQQQRGVRDDVAVLRHFCVQQQLLWPPVLASTHAAYASSELAVLSEHVYALVCTPDLAIAAPPLTPVRLLRRATLVTMLLVAAAGALHRVARYVRQRRLHAS